VGNLRVANASLVKKNFVQFDKKSSVKKRETELEKETLSTSGQL